jgi:hypothetical protein
MEIYDALLTFLLIPCSRVLLEKITASPLVKKFPAFYESCRFITAFNPYPANVENIVSS